MYVFMFDMERVVTLIDMDCFYVQVEQRDNPKLLGQPCAVVQYKKYKGGRYVGSINDYIGYVTIISEYPFLQVIISSMS